MPQELMARYSVIPVDYSEEAKQLTVAMADTEDFDLINDIQVAAGVYIKPVKADEDKVIQWINAFAERAVPAYGISATGNKANSPAIRMVNEIISEAMHTGVSDIHFEPGEKTFLVRFRKDGVLKIARKLPLRSISEITSRIKIMASIDIAEKRRPQDGRIHFDDGTRAVDIRVSALPTDYGQKMVLRLLDKGTIIHKLDSLGMTPAQIALCEKEIHRPYGMFLITGPTGSGKTTTLYTLLQMKRIYPAKR